MQRQSCQIPHKQSFLANNSIVSCSSSALFLYLFAPQTTSTCRLLLLGLHCLVLLIFYFFYCYQSDPWHRLCFDLGTCPAQPVIRIDQPSPTRYCQPHQPRICACDFNSSASCCCETWKNRCLLVRPKSIPPKALQAMTTRRTRPREKARPSRTGNVNTASRISPLPL